MKKENSAFKFPKSLCICPLVRPFFFLMTKVKAETRFNYWKHIYLFIVKWFQCFPVANPREGGEVECYRILGTEEFATPSQNSSQFGLICTIQPSRWEIANEAIQQKLRSG